MAPEEVICIVFVTLAGLVGVTLIPTAIIHSRRRNLPLTILIINCLILDLFGIINALIWFHDDERSWWHGQGLCDIEVKIYLGLGQSLLGATASIFKQLSSILNSGNIGAESSTWNNRQHTVFVVLVCYIIPLLTMAFHYPVQPNRYQIDRFNGCRPTWDPSWLSVLLLWSWYPLVSAICCFYACLATLRLLQHRREVRRILNSSRSRMSKTHFIRLYGLSSVLMCCLIPFAIYFFVSNTHAGALESYSWDRTHPADWSQKIIINGASQTVALDRWVQVASGGLVFLFFGTGHEAGLFYMQFVERAGLVKVYLISSALYRAAFARGQATSPSQASPRSQPPLSLNRGLHPVTWTIDGSTMTDAEIELSLLDIPNQIALPQA